MKTLLLSILILMSLISNAQYTDNKPRFDQFKPMPLMAEVKTISSTGGYQLAHGTAIFNDYLFVGERIDNGTPTEIARVIKYDINTMAELGSYSVGANLDVESLAYDSINTVLYATRYNSSQLEIMSINPSTMALNGSVHTFPSIIPGDSPAICTDGTYIYGVTYTDPTVIFKIRISDWVLVQTSIWTSRERGHAVKIDTRNGYMYATTIPSSSATNPYFIKVDLSTLLGNEISIGTYVKKATDDFAMIDTGGEVYCFIGGEFAVSGYGGVMVKVSDLSVTGFKLKPTYGLSSYRNNIYSCAIDGTIQSFSRFDLNDVWTYNTNGYKLNEIVLNKSGRVICTNFDNYIEARGLTMELALLANTGLGVSSVFGRTGDIVSQTGDYTASQVTNAANTGTTNTFVGNQIIQTTSPYFETINTSAASNGSGFKASDESGINRITLGYNNNTNESYLYGGNNDPLKILLNSTEWWRLKTDGVMEFKTLASVPSATRSGYGGYYVYNNLPYFINSSGTTTLLGGSGGSMTYPSGSGIPLVVSGSSWGTTIALNGNTGTYLNGNGAFTAPTFTSQWTTDTYGITYANNVGIGVASNQLVGLMQTGNFASGNSAYFNNTNTSGDGINSLIGTATDSYYGLKIRAASSDKIRLTGAGTIEMIEQSSSPATPASTFGRTYVKTDGKLYFKNDGGTEYDLTLGSSSGGLTSVGLAMPSIFSVSNSPLTVNGTITASLNNQTANTIFASDGGAPYFRKLVISDISATGTPSASTYLRGDGSWFTPAGATNYWQSGSGYIAPATITDQVRIGSLTDLGATNGGGVLSISGRTLMANSTSNYSVLDVRNNNSGSDSFGISAYSYGSTGAAFIGNATAGGDVFGGTSVSGYGVNVTTGTGVGARFSVTQGSSSSNSTAMQLVKRSLSSYSDGVGNSIDFLIGTNDGFASESVSLNAFITTPTTKFTSKGSLSVMLVNGGTLRPAATFSSIGSSTIGAVLKLAPADDPPASPSLGMIYVDTDTHIYFYNGTIWKQLD